MERRIDNTLDPLLDPFTTSVLSGLQSLADFRAAPEVQALIDELAEKTNQGTATEEELANYERLVNTATLIGIMQAKARKALTTA